MEVILARPRGFCGGVIRAVQIVEGALERFNEPIYVLHEIVHNRHVVDALRDRGARFVEGLGEIPRGAVTIFSAHGVSTEVERRARERGLRVVDATCPLVTRVHRQAQAYSAKGYEVLIIGHAGHPEVEGTRGRVSGPVRVLLTVAEVEALEVPDPGSLAYVTQTTLSVDETREVIRALKERFPRIEGPNINDICHATQSRQNAVKVLSESVDLILVVGARNSSNSNRLRELGAQRGLPSHLVEDAQDLDPGWFQPGVVVGLTAGASTPEFLVRGVLDTLAGWGCVKVSEMEGHGEPEEVGLP